ncbi:MAG: DNA-directed RNA polymerase subunit alpha [Endomicrobiia bacterium]|nr:DNA-directed RNA polymerase subunit alpha [Endomicrobiaceae bacterium]MDD3922702.1 DNA-directed RNA polymerase subunit alpha [Endomicrobiaceae bacterium]MDD5102118.1 DNA-directed RNA polymerase subunit alpha [Endomicrobiaceae bacterium]
MKMPDLEKLKKLQLEEKTATKTFGRFIAQPFERGYGHTIGNSLRRILLSSIEGSAITSANIVGAQHEYAVIKGVREDVLQITLNLKKIRVKLNSAGPEMLHLKVNKAGQITAKDIDKNASVEILNPEQEIANIDAGTTLEMELEVSKGKGYVFASDIKEHKYSAGTIIMDALFSPVTKVNYEVENTRVDQALNYDRLVMEIWTDGSISAQDALIQSAKILRNSLTIFTGEATSESEEQVVEEQAKQEDKTEELKAQSISILDLSTRASNSLKNAEIETIGQLTSYSEIDLMEFDKFGKTSLTEIKKKLEEIGLSLKEQI